MKAKNDKTVPNLRFVLQRLEIRIALQDFLRKFLFTEENIEKYLATISVPAIAAAVYFIIKLIRYAVGENAKFEKFVPMIAAALGVVFAVICFFALPKVIPADNVVIAIVIGAASGFTAIGTDQMMKQFGKNADNSKATAKDKKDEEPPEKDEKNSTDKAL